MHGKYVSMLIDKGPCYLGSSTAKQTFISAYLAKVLHSSPIKILDRKFEMADPFRSIRFNRLVTDLENLHLWAENGWLFRLVGNDEFNLNSIEFPAFLTDYHKLIRGALILTFVRQIVQWQIELCLKWQKTGDALTFPWFFRHSMIDHGSCL